MCLCQLLYGGATSYRLASEIDPLGIYMKRQFATIRFHFLIVEQNIFTFMHMVKRKATCGIGHTPTRTIHETHVHSRGGRVEEEHA
jgi:hypothetical protein